jgi:hypothetical protein
VEWECDISVREAEIGPEELDRLDPFFDSLGRWDGARGEIVIDRGRCERKRLVATTEAVVKAVTIHFCAKAVVQLGVHPGSGMAYIDWDAPAKTFAAEEYPLRPSHAFYAPLVREQELWTQIFAYLYLVNHGATATAEAFLRLSQGHCALYALNYIGLPERRHLPSILVRNWKRDAEENPVNTAACARQIFRWETRGVSVSKEDVFECDWWDE